MCNARGRAPKGAGRTTLYAKTHGEEFPASPMPFGCKVLFAPSEAQGYKLYKPDPRVVTGLLAG